MKETNGSMWLTVFLDDGTVVEKEFLDKKRAVESAEKCIDGYYYEVRGGRQVWYPVHSIKKVILSKKSIKNEEDRP